MRGRPSCARCAYTRIGTPFLVLGEGGSDFGPCAVRSQGAPATSPASRESGRDSSVLSSASRQSSLPTPQSPIYLDDGPPPLKVHLHFASISREATPRRRKDPGGGRMLSHIARSAHKVHLHFASISSERTQLIGAPATSPALARAHTHPARAHIHQTHGLDPSVQSPALSGSFPVADFRRRDQRTN